MSSEIRLPKLGVSMFEATLVEWLVDNGSVVAEGDDIYLLETDKVEQLVESPVSGTISITGVEGETYEVGALLANIS